ncbi:hypothetical protein [Microbacterium terricola]|uniref:Uncharacterized protein n=1 Tax=Microbacterium terricola TaxID=344163 RepID=A0ABM8DVB6_9MICO|nr:hypothetical protein [Microbacterium terricola]UYK39645.1 hypothetical protein OAU46_13210 [Microbacterium terricola]BDV29614.1 hypothetical protein Microterr_02740 [Microbacterium terricola]
MRSIFYAGAEFVTGDEIAAALIDCGRALAEAQLAANVEIPVLEADGSRSAATFLVGPSSQIAVKAYSRSLDELVDSAAVERMRLIVRRVRPTAAAPTTERLGEDGDTDWSFLS